MPGSAVKQPQHNMYIECIGIGMGFKPRGLWSISGIVCYEILQLCFLTHF